MKYLNRYYVLALALLFTCQATFATDYGIEAGLSVEHHSNVFYTPSDETADTIRRAYAAFRLLEIGPVFESRTEARVTHNDYKNNTYDANTVSTLDTLNTLWLIPQSINFDVDYHRAYVPIDSTGLLVPTNQQQINLLSLGPTVAFKLNPVDALQFSYRYNLYSEEISTADNKSNFGAARYIHQFAEKNEMRLNYETRRTDYESDIYQDYNRDDVYASYAYESSTDVYYAEAGKTKVNYHGGLDYSHNRLGLGITHRITRSQTAALTYRDHLSDVAQELGYSQQVATRQPIVVSALQLSNTGDVFNVSAARIEYAMADASGGIRLSATDEKIDYIQSAADEDRTTYSADLSKQLSDNISLTAALSYQDRTIVSTSRNDKIKYIRMAASYRLSYSIFLNGYVAQENSDSSDPAHTYVDHQYGVSVVYQTEVMRNAQFARRYSIPGAGTY